MESKPPHILIIEDDEDTRFVYSVLLKMEGFRVSHVGTMAEGLSRALSTEYKLFVIDVRLPDGDGVELCRKIRSFNKVTPIMFVSAAAYQQDVQRGMKAGAQAYMIKPAEADTLLKNVAYLVGKAHKGLPHADQSILTSLITEATVAAALIDMHKRYKAVSPAYAAAGGFEVAELIGKKASSVFPNFFGEADEAFESVSRSKLPYFISRHPYGGSGSEASITYWDAALWPIKRGESDTDILIVVREKRESGDIASIEAQ